MPVMPNPSHDTSAYADDSLLSGGPFTTKSVTIAAKVGATDGDFVRGRLLNVDATGKYHMLATAETDVPLAAAGEIWLDDFGTATVGPYVFYTAKPPIPGTVHVVTTGDGSATPVLDAGTDNGEGVGQGAGGSFTVDYETGRVEVLFASVPADNTDGKVAYKHRTPDAATLGMPKAVLAEDVLGAKVAADDVVVTVYIGGEFLGSALKGYSAGYATHLQKLGMIIR